MCGACYSGFADVAGTSAPFAAAGVAVARHRWRMRFRRVLRRSTAAPDACATEPVDEPVA